jgi:radical SAM superfamily enzyme YgiQ (UPF0313 family)
MNFIFINPFYEVKKNNIWSIINSEIPPLGLATLAAIWDQQGHTSQIIDAAALKLSIPDIIEKINPAADYVGISLTTPVASNAITIAQKVRKALPLVKIIMGGVHATVFHRELVQDNICDMVIRNEGEFPMMELSKGTPYDLIPNLTWRNSKNELIINPDSTKYIDLNTLPLPAYDKLPMHLYHSALGAAKQEPSIGIITSRGCPGKCTFCFPEMFGSQTRLMSPAKVIEHIEYLQKRHKIREISFYDDTFTANIHHVTEFCHLMLEKKIKLSWSCFTRVDTVTPELLRLMKKAGCHQIMYGFETADDKILKNINKGIKFNTFHNAIHWTRAAKINIRGAFMLGNPGETESSLNETIRFARNAGIQLAVFNITTPFPGTKLYRECIQKNLLLHQNWDLYDLAHPVFKLDALSDEMIKKYYYKSYRNFYLRPALILEFIFSIRTPAEIKIYTKAAIKVLALVLRNMTSRHPLKVPAEVD